MASEASIEEDAVNVAEAVHGFAREKGWRRNDYHLSMRANSDLLVLHVTVVARAYEGRTEAKEFEDYDDLRDYLGAHAGAAVGRFNYVSLVLEGKNGYAFFPAPRLGPSEFEVDEGRINHGHSWSERFRTGGAQGRAK